MTIYEFSSAVCVRATIYIQKRSKQLQQKFRLVFFFIQQICEGCHSTEFVQFRLHLVVHVFFRKSSITRVIVVSLPSFLTSRNYLRTVDRPIGESDRLNNGLTLGLSVDQLVFSRPKIQLLLFRTRILFKKKKKKVSLLRSLRAPKSSSALGRPIGRLF